MDVEGVARIVISLGLEKENPVSVELLRSIANDVLKSPAFSGVDLENVIRTARSMVNVIAEPDTEIFSKIDYEPWIATRFASESKQYWKRYFTYLSEIKCFPTSSLTKLDESTDRVLDLLHDPQDKDAWDRRGLIVGDVQSGKTANYTGLICKAIDAGYKLIVILAGAHNNLRSQTQIRIDEGVLGFDTRYARNREEEAIRKRVGVGNLPPKHIEPVINSLTSSNEKGDFKRASIEGGFMGLGGNPNILCLKKNKSILENVISWLMSHGEPQADGSRLIYDSQLLLIDDEADYASVNTADYVDSNGKIDPERDPTTINRKIRELLNLFSRSAYVGYTATPFANIFIHNETKEAIAGEDLFPRSFIRNIHAPNNYIGPQEFFDVDGNEKDDVGLEQIEYVDDALDIFPPKHKKDLIVVALPNSILKAIHDFFLSCAVRAARGQVNEHNSMLIHVTRFTNVQHQVKELVNDYKNECVRSIRYDEDSELRKVLKTYYENKYRNNSLIATERLGIDDCVDLDWPEVNSHLMASLEKLHVREINGSAGDVLDYLDHPSGLNVIAIGGDKLSRGLTLEGLSVTYFLRASRMYDTLLQMGRWFGYRPGYADVCRLWTTSDLVGWFQHIAQAMAGLREEFDYMASIKATPAEYGLRVATHPDGLKVTGPAKMRAATEHRTGYNNHTAISTTFDCTPRVVRENFEATEWLLESLGTKSTDKGGLKIWKDVSSEIVVDYLKKYQVLPTVITSNTSLIAQYIAEMAKQENELVNWTIGLGINGHGEEKEIAGHKVRQTIRTNIVNKKDCPKDGTYTVRTVLSGSHERADLSDTQIENAKIASGTNNPSGLYLRKERSEKDGLLLIYPIQVKELEKPLIGFVVSFPHSKSGHVITYKVNKVFEQNYMRDLFDVD